MSKVILYHTNTCPICKGVEIKLKQKGIEYTSVTDENELLKLGITHPPVLEVDGQQYAGKLILDWVNKQ